MMPPICELCGRDFRDVEGEGGLVSFTETSEQAERNKRYENPDFVGHPEGLLWFCGEHYPQAKELAHMDSHTALETLRKQTQQ